MKKGGIMWIARDEYGSLYIYKDKPCKGSYSWNCHDIGYFQIEDTFPEVKWEDEEPTEVELIIKKK